MTVVMAPGGRVCDLRIRRADARPSGIFVRNDSIAGPQRTGAVSRAADAGVSLFYRRRGDGSSVPLIRRRGTCIYRFKGYLGVTRISGRNRTPRNYYVDMGRSEFLVAEFHSEERPPGAAKIIYTIAIGAITKTSLYVALSTRPLFPR